MERTLSIHTGAVVLEADLRLVDDARGLVLFAHGSGSNRKSPRNRRVARALELHGLATVLLDLLTERRSGHRRHPRALSLRHPAVGAPSG